MKLRGLRGRAHARRVLVGLSCAAVAFAASDIALVRVVGASQDDTQAANYDVYNGQVSATADREQVGTSVDANFSAGAIDNFYPLAYTDVAVAGTNALATWADTGPFVQAVLGGGLNGEVLAQPQYVHAQYPGTQNPGPKSTGTGASASASVTPASATATAYADAAGNTPTADQSAATQQALATSLAAWKQKFMGAPAAAPTAPPTCSTANPTSNGTDGDTGIDSVYFDSVKGFITTGSSRVQSSSFGGGQIVIDKVRVDATITNPGDGSAPKNSVSIQVGSASVCGVPVSIGKDGVTVVSPLVPADQVQQVSQALNAALAQAGFSVHLITPVQAVEGSSEHVDAVGVQVAWVQPGSLTPPGVPSQFVTHTLGDVVLDNEATLSPPTSSLLGTGGASLSSGFSGGGYSTTTTTSGGTGSTATPVQQAPPKHPAAPASVRITPSRPGWLLLFYLAWQALLIGTAASIYLWRSGVRLTSLTR